MKTLLVKCQTVQWQPDGLTIHTKQLFLGAGFLGAPPISLSVGKMRSAGLQPLVDLQPVPGAVRRAVERGARCRRPQQGGAEPLLLCMRTCLFDHV